MIFQIGLSGWFLWLTMLMAACSVAVAIRVAPWPAVFQHPARQHLWLGSIVLLTLVWTFIHFSVANALTFHPVLITSVTLIFGAPLAIVAGAISLLFTSLLSHIPLSDFGLNLLLNVVAISLSTQVLLLLIQRARVQNLFLYLLGAGFGGGLLGTVVIATLSQFASLFADPVLFDLNLESLPLYFLLMFPEGFTNGTIISSLAVFRPDWVKTYDEEFYLRKHGDN